MLIIRESWVWRWWIRAPGVGDISMGGIDNLDDRDRVDDDDFRCLGVLLESCMGRRGGVFVLWEKKGGSMFRKEERERERERQT